MTSNTPRNSRTAVGTALERLHHSTHEPRLCRRRFVSVLSHESTREKMGTVVLSMGESFADYKSGQGRIILRIAQQQADQPNTTLLLRAQYEGHAAAPPMSPMNSRRLMPAPVYRYSTETHQ